MNPCTLSIPPLGPLAKLADAIMTPVMYLVSGTFREAPQRTHRWNNLHLKLNDVHDLDPESTVEIAAEESAKQRGVIHFHLPFLGGWKTYVVLKTDNRYEKWHVGWVALDKKGISTVGVSRLAITGPLRMLRGDGGCRFFGISAKSGEQIPIMHIGDGHIGDGSRWKHLPLL